MAEIPEIDDYSDLTRVAKGGFGVVYRARQNRFGRVVALKVLDVDDLDEHGRRRFERECVAMGTLGWHPNVVAIFDSGIDGAGHPYIVMEYLDGGSLADRLGEGPVPWEVGLTVGVQVASALGAAHAAGILHRDLKPENLLVGPFGEIKLADFGIAAVEGATRTTAGHASFTVAHVAPEILRRQRPDERSDLYSLASTLYTLIAGAPPFRGEPDESIATQIARVLHDPAPSVDNAPADLIDLLKTTMAKDPSHRPKSAAEFGRRLQLVQANNGQPVTGLRLAPTLSVIESAVSAPVVADTTPVSPTVPRESTSEHGADVGTVTDPRPPPPPTRPPPPPSPTRPPPPVPYAANSTPSSLSHPPTGPWAAPGKPGSGSSGTGALVALVVGLVAVVAVGGLLLIIRRSDTAARGAATAAPSTSVTAERPQVTGATAAVVDEIPPGQDPRNILGNDDALNSLANDCFDGNMASCDQLFEDTPVGSDLETYAQTCGGRIDEQRDTPDCAARFVEQATAQLPGNLGNDPTFDGLADDCFGGDFGACDDLFLQSPVDSAYEAYGSTCGGRLDTGISGRCDARLGRGSG